MTLGILSFRRADPEDAVDIDVSPMDRRIQSRRYTPRKLVMLGLALAVLAIGIFGYVRYGLTRTLNIETQRIVISPVSAGSFHDYVPVIGNVQPRETVYLDAVDGGQVIEILVEEGSLVTVGQPLLRLNNASLQFQYVNSQSQHSEQLNLLTSTKLAFEQTKLSNARELVDMRFQIDKTKLQLQRLEALESTGGISRADVENARLDLIRLESFRRELEQATKIDAKLQRELIVQLDQAAKGLNVNLALARQNLDNLAIKAPISGQLTSLDAHLGESKLPSQRLGQIDQVDSFKVVALVDEHYLARVTAGQDASAQIDGVDYRLRLVKVYPEVRERQFKVDLTFSGAVPKSVRRGQSLQLRLEIGASSTGLILANGAFYEDTGGQWAFVVADNTAERRAVRFGRRNPEQVEVLEGLRPGERVITSSYETLKQYDRIELRGD